MCIGMVRIFIKKYAPRRREFYYDICVNITGFGLFAFAGLVSGFVSTTLYLEYNKLK